MVDINQLMELLQVYNSVSQQGGASRSGGGQNPYMALFLQGLKGLQAPQQDKYTQMLKQAQNPSSDFSTTPIAEPPGASFWDRLKGQRYADPNVFNMNGQAVRLDPPNLF